MKREKKRMRMRERVDSSSIWLQLLQLGGFI